MKLRGKRRPSRFKKGTMYDVVVRPPGGSDHPPGDDCELCRRMAGRAPIEVITMPDGTVYEVHEMPPPGSRGAPS